MSKTETAQDIRIRCAREMAAQALDAMREVITDYRQGIDYDPRRIEREALQELVDGLDKLRDVVQDCVRVLPEADEDEDVAEAAE